MADEYLKDILIFINIFECRVPGVVIELWMYIATASEYESVDIVFELIWSQYYWFSLELFNGFDVVVSDSIGMQVFEEFSGTFNYLCFFGGVRFLFCGLLVCELRKL